jgi:serine O-acetyltransferase
MRRAALRVRADVLVDLLEEAFTDAVLTEEPLEEGCVFELITELTSLGDATDSSPVLLGAKELEEVRQLSVLDAQAHYDGDPAATSVREVVLAYPGWRALLVHRVAHRLTSTPVLARLLAEAAHQRTGIDVHPRAQIGVRAMIDHGTGVVIGSTAVVGDDVRLYHGVTLGALSTRSRRDGPRHPRVGDRVVLYAHASVLGPVRVGDDCVLGASTTTTTDLPPRTRVVAAPCQEKR